jgi:hypothetical protein
MTLKELIELYRADAFDGQEQMFCSDALLTIYANEAQDEACRRGQLLRDSSSGLCTISFDATDETVNLDARVLRVLRAFVDGQEADVVNVEEMDCSRPGWQFQAGTLNSRPLRLVTGMSTGKLHLWPKPSQAGTIRLTVQRLPLKPMRAPSDSPEIRPELHRALVPWMLYRAYSREDTELYNDRKAAVHLAKFEAEFGGKASGRNEEWERQGLPLMPGPIA